MAVVHEAPRQWLHFVRNTALCPSFLLSLLLLHLLHDIRRLKRAVQPTTLVIIALSFCPAELLQFCSPCESE